MVRGFCGRLRNERRKITDEVTESDKQKLVWGMLIHLLKRESLRAVNAPSQKSDVADKNKNNKTCRQH